MASNLKLQMGQQARLLAAASLKDPDGIDPILVESVLNQSRTEKVGALDIVLDQQQQLIDPVLRFCAGVLDMPFLELASAIEEMSTFTDIDLDTVTQLQELETLMLRSPDGQTVFAATANPFDLEAKRLLSSLSESHRLNIVTVIGRADVIKTESEQARQRIINMEAVSSLTSGDYAVETDDLPEDLSGAASRPIEKLADNILETAVVDGASDIHLNVQHSGRLQIRIRVDGVMRVMDKVIPPGQERKLIAHLMVRSDPMDVSNMRRTQDGRITWVAQGRKLEGRVNFIPAIAGPKMTIRILDKSSISIPLHAMGFSEHSMKVLRKAAARTQGAMLVSGPTGSGKTTTLYALLSEVNTPELNIMTAENPVEYQLAGLTQVQMKPKAGLTFEKTLEAFLRADPDIILVGEIRNTETAKIAADASITGHLVLSTIHAPSAAEVFTRFIEMGVPGHVAADAVSVTTAQRLLRRACTSCKEFTTPTDNEKTLMEDNFGYALDEVVHANGCSKCGGKGYAKRIAVAEVMESSEKIRHLVAQSSPAGAIRAAAREENFISLQEDAFRHVESGVTTLEELIRGVDLAI